MSIITSQDMNHMKAFPVSQRARILREIMSRSPVAERNYEGNTHFVKTILKLRADGLRLIDLQPFETAFASIWYKKNGKLIGKSKSDVAALVVWEGNAYEGDTTTIKVWRI